MSGDIFQFKPNFHGIGIDFNERKRVRDNFEAAARRA
jgi:hypothetical protein